MHLTGEYNWMILNSSNSVKNSGCVETVILL